MQEPARRRTGPDAGPAPAGEDAWWHPAHLGGTAPTPAEAAAMDASDREDRIARGEPSEG
ncbi:hypothetical protein GCM10025868_19670 [Angustibacter aerolatus]|uniref:Uncharacterized protein n=1 Tax=Angustibacter aerolatus TaxID=1162965 RepID=A0ABQ6JIN4_9ACTN|nr:hypothetical protein GCM10025868_19670 [Angustibacter aerolatus]